VLDSLPSWHASDVEPREPADTPLEAPASLDHDVGFGTSHLHNTLHGPALPDDPPSAIYDDFGGALAMEDEVTDLDARDSMDVEDAPASRWSDVFIAPVVHEEEGGIKFASNDAKEDAGACTLHPGRPI
jgi:hypothetical protein